MTLSRAVLLPLLFASWSCAKPGVTSPADYACSDAISSTNPQHPRDLNYQNLLLSITKEGVPGIMLTVQDPIHNWSGAEGMADLETGQPLRACNITRVGSTVKTFTAVAILLLEEENKIQLDNPVSQYLPAGVLNGLENAPQATVRQLLQHSSGIYNYILNLEFQTASLNNLTRVWQPEELLGYARGKKADFPPGADVSYSNTNYILLGMIIEAIEHKPFFQVFEERIFHPLGMEFARFAALDPVPEGIIRGYVDLYSNLQVIDATQYSGWDYFTADGGLIANAHDLALFMRALFEGRILSQASLEEMLDWKTPSGSSQAFYDADFGLGIFRMSTPYGEAYMHSGDAIGYYATMFYFPGKQTAIAWAVNGNYGKIDQFTQSKEAMDRIFSHIFD